MLDAVLAWYDRGCVPIPLKPRSKRPSMPWRRLQTDRPPRAVVKRWFSSGEHNVGVLCGAISDNLVVLDFDKALAFYQWRERFGNLDTYMVRTARGHHVYLRVQEMVVNSLSMEGGDVKASGYVVAPPSVHESGVVYTALDECAEILTINALGDVGIEIPAVARRAVVSASERARGPGLIDAIKAELPITVLLSRHTQLIPAEPSGEWFAARCPFHDDRNPSMWVNARLGICGCYATGCRANVHRGYDVINLYALFRDISNEQAIYELAGILGV